MIGVASLNLNFLYVSFPRQFFLRETGSLKERQKQAFPLLISIAIINTAWLGSMLKRLLICRKYVIFFIALKTCDKSFFISIPEQML